MEASQVIETIGVAIAGGAASGALIWRLIIAEMRVQIAQSEERTRGWINGSFMRAGEIRVQCAERGKQLEGIEHRLDRIEEQL
jgi:hypothetical protein